MGFDLLVRLIATLVLFLALWYSFLGLKEAIMVPSYLLGEPLLKPNFQERLFAPLGQFEAFHAVFRELQEEDAIAQKFREEYLAIAHCLVTMDVDFRIILSHREHVDAIVLRSCIRDLGCGFVGLPDWIHPSIMIYPRDLCTVLPGITLLSSKAVAEWHGPQNNGIIMVSDLGEGGRVLHSGTTMICTNNYYYEEGIKQVNENDLRKLAELNIRVILLPMPAVRAYDQSGWLTHYAYDPHLDRFACLLRAKDGTLHMVVDSMIYQTHLPGGFTYILKRVCDHYGLELHFLKEFSIPLVLNLIQFKDGRVLMSGGDPEAAGLVADIVGAENVFRTPRAIRFLPTWTGGGIRCFLTETPPIFPESKEESSVVI